ncbi:MAG: preprotein translocase subunit SecE [Anaeroplasmataceae bacterium]|jgi:SecE/Sec61-gamma subunits of protein translocation complex.|nr:preprotein translocase subunit SecE [Anaeroplasmataceae bacterium]
MAVKEKTGEKQSRIWQYLKETHKWENYVFLIFAVLVLVLGCLILTSSLTVKENFWLIGEHPMAFGWVLVSLAGVFTLYGLYPFFKPAFPEFKKITWLTFGKWLGNSIRVLLFLVIFALLFLLYDAFITQVLSRIFEL